jgi:predicted transcriptional regulator
MSSLKQEKKIRDIMVAIKQFPSVKSTSLIKEAVCLIQKAQESQSPDCGILLVIDDTQNWIGVTDRKMVLRTLGLYLENHICRSGGEVYSDRAPPFEPGLFTECCRLQLARCVEEIMYPREVVIIGIDDDLPQALHLMTEGEVDSLVVVEDNEPIGVVHSVDVFNEIGRSV